MLYPGTEENLLFLWPTFKNKLLSVFQRDKNNLLKANRNGQLNFKLSSTINKYTILTQLLFLSILDEISDDKLLMKFCMLVKPKLINDGDESWKPTREVI